MELRLHNEKELLCGLADGDEAAFRELYLTYYDKVYSIGILYLKSHEPAEDITQQVFMKLWSKREDLRTVENIDGWLFVVTRNYIFNQFRRQTAQDSHRKYLIELFSDGLANPEEALILKDRVEMLESVIASLPERQRRAYRLHRLKGMKYADIAEEMGISVFTVREHIAVASQRVKSLLLSRKDEFLLLCLLSVLGA